MRFHVDVTAADGAVLLNTGLVNGQPQAGFSAVSAPSYSVESAEYREGHYIYTRKQPGKPSVEDITMSRGVTVLDTSFYAWVKTIIEGGEYRADLSIKHYARDKALPGQGVGLGNLVQIDLTKPPSRIYTVSQAYATGHKVSGDFDATSSDIAVQELTVAFEYFDVITNP